MYIPSTCMLTYIHKYIHTYGVHIFVLKRLECQMENHVQPLMGGGGAQPKGTSTQAPPGVLSFVTYYDIRYQHYRFR